MDLVPQRYTHPIQLKSSSSLQSLTLRGYADSMVNIDGLHQLQTLNVDQRCHNALWKIKLTLIKRLFGGWTCRGV